MKEKKILNNVIEYLKLYDFSENNVLPDMQISYDDNNALADVVLIADGAVFAVIEVKVAAQINHADKESLIISPFIRQLQTYAHRLNAPYYIFTNGADYIWFKTDDTGRPMIVEPVKNPRNINSSTNFFSFEEAIRACQNILKHDGASINLTYELLLLFISHIAPRDINTVNRIIGFDLDSELNKLQEATLKECKKILGMLDWNSIDKQDFLFALDLVLTRNNYIRTYKIPLWLADFMVRLSDVNDNSIVYDPHANFGEIQTAITLSGKAVRSAYQFYTIEGALLSILTKVLMDQSINDITFAPSSQYNCNFEYGERPDRIITALPFGSRADSLNHSLPFKLSDLSDQILLKSLIDLNENGVLTALVPESFLFGGGQRKQLRDYIINSFMLRNIVSLPVGSLSPYSSVKSSIIVIKKKESRSSPYDILMTIVEEPLLQNRVLDCRDIPVINAVLDASATVPAKNTIKVPATELRDIITVDTYFEDLNITPVDYPLVALKDICKIISKGRNIKLDDTGDIPVIGPGAIRPFNIDPLQFNITCGANVDQKSMKVQKGDILINSISTFLGSAAMVKNDIEGYCSQHVITITPDLNKINPEYLEIALNSKYVRAKIQSAVSGSVIPSLNVTRVRELMIPIPSLDVQLRLIEQVNSKLIQIQILKEQLSLAEEEFGKIVNNLGIGED